MTAVPTRDASYHAIEDLAEQQREVLEVIRSQGPLSDREIAAWLERPINRIVPRRHELVAAGLVVEAGTVLDHETGRRVVTWKCPPPVVTDGALPPRQGVSGVVANARIEDVSGGAFLANLPHPAIWRWRLCPGEHDEPRPIPGWWPACPQHSPIDWKRVEREAERLRAGYAG